MTRHLPKQSPLEPPRPRGPVNRWVRSLPSDEPGEYGVPASASYWIPAPWTEGGVCGPFTLRTDGPAVSLGDWASVFTRDSGRHRYRQLLRTSALAAVVHHEDYTRHTLIHWFPIGGRAPEGADEIDGASDDSADCAVILSVAHARTKQKTSWCRRLRWDDEKKCAAWAVRFSDARDVYYRIFRFATGTLAFEGTSELLDKRLAESVEGQAQTLARHDQIIAALELIGR